MNRNSELRECRNIVDEHSPGHLHIRRRAIVTGFVNDLQTELKDYRTVTVDISEWKRDELMETLRNELQKELSRVKYYLSHARNFGGTLFGFGANAGVESRPDYTRVTDYLQQVESKTDGHLIIFINHHGKGPVDGFGWIPKLDIPENATIVTDGYTTCELANTVQFEIGRLTESRTVEYLTRLERDIGEEEAVKIHHIHDGNPVAIQIAAEEGSLREPLSGRALDRLWNEVYHDKVTADEFDLLTDSSHLIDLDRRAVTSVTEMRRGKVRDLLGRLESKGIVSDRGAGLFTTDQYVKRYTARELSGSEFSEQHRMSFHDHAERWVEGYESRVQEMRNSSETVDEAVSAPDFDSGLTDPNLFLAIHHLSAIHSKLDKDTFIQELRDLDAETSGVFSFGMLAQRFFFEEPMDVLQDLSEEILGIDEDIENELFSGTLGVLFDFNVQRYMTELSKGWSSNSINTNELNINVSQPDNVVEKIQQGIDSDLYADLPPELKTAVTHFAVIPFTDTRTARGYYQRFGKTASKYGLEEEPFVQWLGEVELLINEMSPTTETASEGNQQDPHEESFKSLNNEIRDRLELEEQLKENHSQSQEEFQQRLELIRDRPDEIAKQYVRCGEQLEEMDNCMFAYLWYAVGHEVFSKVVLGKENWKIYGAHSRLSGAREQYEKSRTEEELVVTKEEIDELFS